MKIDYLNEARERWGNTDAYREHEKKTKNYTKEKWSEVNDGLMAIFAEFAERKNNGFVADSPEVQSLVVKLQEYITQNIILAQMISSRVLVKYMLQTSDSRRISINMASALPLLFTKQLRHSVR